MLTHSLTHLLTYLLTHSLTYLLTYLLTHSLTYLLTYSLTYLLTRSLTHSRCLIPRDNSWHFGALNSILSWKHFEPLSQLTYASYIIHFRLLMELIFHQVFKRYLIGDNHYETESQWMGYMVRVFVIATCTSLVLAYVIHHVIEKPVQNMLGTNWNKALKRD